MLQRIQTIYLLLALCSLVAAFFFPFANISTESVLQASGAFSSDFSTSVETLLPFPIGYLLIGLIGLISFTILQYKNRKRQMLLTKIAYLLSLATVVAIYLSINSLLGGRAAEDVGVVYGIATYMPVVALVFLFLAHRAIKKDEELVRSNDRLR